ncbi:hypothetical protein HPB49_011586 [Dermacentor silvarum]|uniref:Uncharacterized protein n=1 Tax=Dermacentor silvarum TaxID=543639 RepID=A0ACB8DZM8_DERSI|nr:hypothetical protein HPB49_011586 [Dermacentor silvarum]
MGAKGKRRKGGNDRQIGPTAAAAASEAATASVAPHCRPRWVTFCAGSRTPLRGAARAVGRLSAHGRRIVQTKTVQSSMLRKKIINHVDGTKDIVEEIITPGSQTMLSRDRPMTEAEFQKDSLDWHNYYRTLHGVPALQLDAKAR